MYLFKKAKVSFYVASFRGLSILLSGALVGVSQPSRSLVL